MSPDRRAAAARFSSAPQPVEQAADDARAARTARTRPVRSSVDLSPARHHALRDRENELMRELGAVRGLRQHLLAALVGVYLTDEAFARRVDAELADELRKR